MIIELVACMYNRKAAVIVLLNTLSAYRPGSGCAVGISIPYATVMLQDPDENNTVVPGYRTHRQVNQVGCSKKGKIHRYHFGAVHTHVAQLHLASLYYFINNGIRRLGNGTLSTKSRRGSSRPEDPPCTQPRHWPGGLLGRLRDFY